MDGSVTGTVVVSTGDSGVVVVSTGLVVLGSVGDDVVFGTVVVGTGTVEAGSVGECVVLGTSVVGNGTVVAGSVGDGVVSGTVTGNPVVSIISVVVSNEPEPDPETPSVVTGSTPNVVGVSVVVSSKVVVVSLIIDTSQASPT